MRRTGRIAMPCHVHIGLNWAGAKGLTSFWKGGFGGR